MAVPAIVSSSTALATWGATGCADLDYRVLGAWTVTDGGVLGISADGSIGLVAALVVTVRRLLRDPTATARIVTTHPAVQIVRLLRDVLRRVVVRSGGDGRDGDNDDGTRLTDRRAAVLRRFLVSRVYGPADLGAVLDELEGGTPFQRLWTAGVSDGRATTVSKGAGDGNDEKMASDADQSSPAAQAPPCCIVFTEMDHHLKWMRLQGGNTTSTASATVTDANVPPRLHEQYMQLMRRLRGITARTPATLVIILNGTFVPIRLAADGQDGTGDEGPTTATIATTTNEQLARMVLAQQTQALTPALVRLCCREVAEAQHVTPRHGGLMNYACRLHICFVPLPADVGAVVADPAVADTTWVASVVNDEDELIHRERHEVDNDDYDEDDYEVRRTGLVGFSQGMLWDVLPV